MNNNEHPEEEQELDSSDDGRGRESLKRAYDPAVNETQIPLKKRQLAFQDPASSSSSASTSCHETKEGEDMSMEGYLMWAKIKGFSYWPGVTTVDPYEGVTVKTVESSSKKISRKSHVHFLAYDNLRAWVHESNILPYEGIEKYRELAYKSKRKKDFLPGKRLQSLFDRAVAQAESIVNVPIEKRCEKLGFVYVLIENQDNKVQRSTENRRKRKRSASTEKPKKNNNDGGFKKAEASDKSVTKSPNKNGITEVKPFHLNNSNNSVITEEPSKDDNDDNDSSVEEPKLGSLIWGRMPGFPYWPCFVTKNPAGEYKKGKGVKKSFHVQFFNWNDESGWVTKTMPWCSIEEYRQKAKEAAATAARNGTPNSGEWQPMGKMLHKWKNAVLQAEGTAGLSRRERHNKFIVTYKEIQDGGLTSHYHPVPTKGSQKAFIKDEEEKQQQQLPFVTSTENLPPGWVMREFSNKKTEYQSPDGTVFNTIKEAAAHLFQQNSGPLDRKRSYSTCSTERRKIRKPGPLTRGWFITEADKARYPVNPYSKVIEALNLDGNVSYMVDSSLPKEWIVKRIGSRTTYLSPEVGREDGGGKLPLMNRKEFKSKLEVASYLEGMGHPAVELEHLIMRISLFNEPNNNKDDEDDDDGEDDEEDFIEDRPPRRRSKVICTVNINEEMSSQQPQLSKVFVPCSIDMVQLPDVFLDHPSVVVMESENEMTITDVHTGEFIAKKIIYE